MTEVLVAGGGVAGVAAAIRASSLGAKVRLLEGSTAVGQSKSDLLLLLRGELKREDLRPVSTDELRKKFGIETLLRKTVLGVDTKRQLLETADSRIKYDSLVLATGGAAAADGTKGVAKKGVHFMKGLDDYAELSHSLDNLSSVAVQGSTALALELAEILAKRKLRVTLFSDASLSVYLSGPIERMVLSSLGANGVRVVGSGMDRIAGMEKVEAVLSGGSVYPCEAVVVVPRIVPAIPRIVAKMGASGGILVDKWMRTSEPCVFAAGDCAELSVGSSSFPLRLQSAARIMGEVAGANAAGATEVARISGTLGLRIFGLELCSAGLTLGAAKRAGYDAKECNYSSPEDGLNREPVCCSLVYDGVSRAVYGIQVAGWKALSYSDFASLAISMGVGLSDLAYLESSYLPNVTPGESPIAATAKRALSSP